MGLFNRKNKKDEKTKTPQISSADYTGKTPSNAQGIKISKSEIGQSDFAKYTQQHAEDSFNNSGTDFSAWMDSANNLLSNYAGYTMQYNSKDNYDDYKNKLSSLLTSAQKHRGQYGDDPEVASYIDSITSALGEAYKGAGTASEYYSKWKDKTDYDKYLRNYDKYGDTLDYDAKAGKQEVDELQRKLHTANSYGSDVTTETVGGGMGFNLSRNSSEKQNAYLKSIGYDTLADLKSELSAKEAYLNQATRLQNTKAYEDRAMQSSDFDRYANKGANQRENMVNRISTNYDVEAMLASGNAGDMNPNYDGQKASGLDKALTYLSDDELKVYNYYYGKYGEKEANQYLSMIQDTLNQRYGQSMAADMHNKRMQEYAFSIAAGLDQFTSGMNAIGNDADYIPTSATQYASAGVREDLGNVGKQRMIFGGATGAQALYDLGTTSANMLPSIGVSMMLSTVAPVIGEVAGAALLGTSAGGNAYTEMLNLGYDKDQAKTYAIATGVLEAGLQYALGGVAKLGGKGVNALTEGKIKSINNAVARFAIDYGKDVVSEGIEEGLQEIINPFLKNAIFNTDEKVDWEQVLYSALLGAASAGALNGTGIVATKVGEVQTAKQIIANNQAENLIKLGQSFSADTVAYKVANKVNDNSSAWQMSQLLHEVNATLSEQNQSDIANALVEKGVRESDAQDIATWLNAAVNGKKFNARQRKVLETDPNITEVFRDTVFGDNLTENQKMSVKGRNELYQNLYTKREVAPTNVDESKLKGEVKESAPSENATEETTLNSTGEKIKIASIISNDENGMKLKLDNGNVVNAADVTLSDTDETLINGLKDMDLNAANQIIADYDASEGVSPEVYVLGAKEAYNYGSINMNKDYVGKDTFAADLSPRSRDYIYNLGKTISKFNAENKQSKIDAKVKETKASGKQTAKEGKLVYHSGLSKDTKYNAVQSASIKVAEQLSKIVGNDIHLYQSVRQNGKLVMAEDLGGRKAGQSAPNGMFTDRDGSIYIDINAGGSGAGTMLYTLAHEYTHFIRQYAPAKFKALADFLVSEYGDKGVPMKTLIHNQQVKAQKSGRTLSFDEAYEEFVADSMEKMLSDTDVVVKLAKLKQTDKALWERLRDMIQDMLNKAKAIYRLYNPDSQEANFLAEMTDSLQKLSDLFAEGLAEASNAYQALSSMTETEVETAVEEGKAILPEQEVKFSIKNDTEYMKQAVQLAEKTGYKYVSKKRLAEAAKARELVQKKLTDPNLVDKLKLPEDIEGNTFLPDSSYGGTEENTTVCVRSMAAQALMDEIAKDLGRPLTVEDTLIISQEMMTYLQKPECIYCYVATDRRAYRQYLGDYLVQRDNVISALKNGKSKEKVYKDFLAGRKDTANMKYRFSMFEALASGEKTISAKDIASVEDLFKTENELRGQITTYLAGKNSVDAESILFTQDKRYGGKFQISRDGKKVTVATLSSLMKDTKISDAVGTYRQIFDAMNYAQSASWAKKMMSYTAYNNHILKWKQDKVSRFNEHYGLRMYSFSDYSPAFVLENMQMLTDASVKGLKCLAYTKETDFARIFAPTGANINISVFASENNGTVLEDEMMGANWAEAIELRNKYPNVGITLVATNDTILEWGLNNPNVDVVIPYHLVRTGQEVANYFGYKNYTKDSADGKINVSSFYKKKQTSVYPSDHQNDFAKYFKKLEELALTPRFENYLNGYEQFKAGAISMEEFREMNPNYMKLVNETRQSADATNTVQPVFDTEAALASIDTLAEEGGYNRGFMSYLGKNEKAASKTYDKILNKVKGNTKLSDREVTELAKNASTNYDSVIANEGAKYSDRVVDKKTIDFLENQEHITTYKSMQLIDGKLYPPMAAIVAGQLEAASELGKWEQAVEHPELIKIDKKSGKPKFALKKGKGQGSVDAAYNPYMHSSNLVLNDQFTSAYKRNLVTVECEIPVSELTSGYKAQYAKDSVGMLSWHTGVVAGQLPKSQKRMVYLTRWLKPVRIVPDAEVAQMYADLLVKDGITVPNNVVPSSLLTELEKVGVEIDYSGIDRVEKRTAKFSDRDEVEVYRGTKFGRNSASGITWYAENEPYAKNYGDTTAERITLGNMFDAGNTSATIYNGKALSPEAQNVLDAAGWSEKYLMRHFKNASYVWQVVNSTDFRDAMIRNGYDTIKAVETGDQVAYGVLNEQKNNTTDGDVKYSLREFADGRRFVDVNTDQALFNGLTTKEQSKLARKIIQENFVGKVIGIDNKAYVNSRSASEYAFSVKLDKDSKLREAKYRAAPELDNLVDAGDNFRTEPDGRDGHSHPTAIDDFRYFDTVFKIGKEYYKGVVNIIPEKRGLRLKDVTKIENITKDIFGSYGQNPQVKFLRDVSMDSILQSSENINTKFSDRDSDGNELSAAQQKFFKDSKIRDEDGNLMIVYHGTSENFTVFDRNKGRANMDIQGMFFSPWELDAQGYGENVGAYYINITNPASESVAYKALQKFKGQNGAGIKAREYLESLGYDGVNNSNEEFIAFNSNQIKLASNLNPTENEDIRYSDRITPADIADFDKDTQDIIKNAKRRVMYAMHPATMTVERFDNAFSDMTDKGYFATIDPWDFLFLTTSSVSEFLERNPNRLNEGVSEDWGTKNNIQESGALFLRVEEDDDGNWKVVGHEGRHRMAALYRENVDKVSVAIRVVNADKLTPQKIKRISPQFGRGSNEWIHDAIPATTEYKDVARKIFASEQGNIRYSERDTESLDNRTVLANAMETAAQNDIERKFISDYKENIEKMNAEEQKLGELKTKIKEISFAKGKRDTARLRELQAEATKTANRINTYDKKLLKLEAAKPLKDVIERERTKARKAGIEKGKQSLLNYRQRQSDTMLRRKIQKVTNTLKDYLLTNGKDKHVLVELQKVVAESLDVINMTTANPETVSKSIMTRMENLQKQIAKETDPKEIEKLMKTYNSLSGAEKRSRDRLAKLKKAYEDIRTSDDPFVANGYDEVVAAKIDEVTQVVGETPLYRMNTAQLQAVYDMYKMILERVRNANKSFVEGKRQTIIERGTRVMTELDALEEHKKVTSKARQTAELFRWNNLKPLQAFKGMRSDEFESTFRDVLNGESVWAKDINEARAFCTKEFQKYDVKKWLNDTETKEFESIGGKKFNLTLQQRMSLFAYSRREAARDHIRKGGIVIDIKTEVKKGIVTKSISDAETYGISDETLDAICDSLTAEQRQFVIDMVNYLSTVMGAKGNEISRAMYGINLFGEKNYFPLKSSDMFLPEKQQNGEVNPKIKNSGFTNSLVPHASNPVVLSDFIEVWDNHVDEMSRYHAFVLPLEDFYRIYNFKQKTEVDSLKSVDQSIRRAHGESAVKFIEQLLNDLNGGTRADTTAGVANKLLSTFKKGAVMGSMSVVIQQPSAFARVFSYIEPKYFIGSKVANTEKAWEEVKKYAPVAIIKEMGGYDTHTGQSTRDYLSGEASKKNVVEKFDDVLGMFPAKADEITWIWMWQAAKRKARHEGLEGEALLTRAGKIFAEGMQNTQVYDSVLSRSANMRSKDGLMKMATAFMAEPTTTLNMVADARLDWLKGNKKTAIGKVASVVTSVIINAALVSLIYAARDDDDDETYKEKYTSSFISKSLEGVNPLTYIPFVKDIYSIVQGYTAKRTDLSVFSDMMKSVQNLSKAVENDDPEEIRKTSVDTANQFLMMFGIPTKNITRDIRAIFNTYHIATEGENATEKGMFYAKREGLSEGSVIARMFIGDKPSNKEQLYNAVVEDDTEHEERVRGRYDSEDKSNTAFRQAVMDSYDKGNITKTQAVSLLVKSGGMEQEDAEKKVADADFKKQYGFTYSERGEAYANGEISRSQLISIMTKHGMDADKAEQTATIYDWQKEGIDIDSTSISVIQDYYEFIEPSGIDKKTFYDAYKFYRDSGEEGVKYSKTEETIPYIDSLPLSSEQKTQLALCWWSAKTVNKYKTW